MKKIVSVFATALLLSVAGIASASADTKSDYQAARAKTVDLPITGTQEIFEVVKNLYLALNLENVLIRLIGVSLDSLVEDEEINQMVLGQRTSGWQQADKAVDRIKNKFGSASLRPARLVEDHEEN